MVAIVWSIALLMAVVAVTVSPGPLDALAAAVYELGSLICHQRPERSFSTAGAAWPVCARCSGLYAGALLGTGIGLWLEPPASWDRLVQSTRLWLPVAAAPTAWTVGVEWVTGVMPSHWMRALSAVPLGAALVIVLIVAAAWPPRAVGVH